MTGQKLGHRSASVKAFLGERRVKNVRMRARAIAGFLFAMSKKRRVRWIALVVALVVVAALEAKDVYRYTALRDLRTTLFAAIRPVRLSNCVMKRFGAPHDGGYLLCENLTGQARSAYSYGIDGRDEWGCDVARSYHLPVHQYDCFNPKRPVCDGADFHFNDECVGGGPARIDGRAFDGVTNQIARNGDAGKHLLVKMDVESAEWESLAATPDSTLENIDQLDIEFHELDDPTYIDVIEKLKKTFYIVNVHFNNYACMWWSGPFPGLAYELLFVNKRLGVLDTANPWADHPNALDAPNKPSKSDCQAAAWSN
jgi:hypothetical protein